jgi:hypothetical protein
MILALGNVTALWGLRLGGENNLPSITSRGGEANRIGDIIQC